AARVCRRRPARDVMAYQPRPRLAGSSSGCRCRRADRDHRDAGHHRACRRPGGRQGAGRRDDCRRAWLCAGAPRTCATGRGWRGRLAAAVAAARPATTGTLATTGLAAARATARTRAAGTIAAGPGTARTLTVGIERAGVGVVGGEARRIAGVPVGMCRTALATTTRTARIPTRAAGAGTPRAAGSGLAAMRLARTTRTVGIAMAAGTGVDAIGYVPGAERRGILRSRTRLAAARILARLARPLGLERLVDLLGRRLAADREAAVWLLAAAPAPVLAHVVEAAQFAALVGGGVAADVTLGAMTAHVHRGLGRLALADHRLQRQCRRRAVLQAEFLAQRLDAICRQFLRMPAQQRPRQFDTAVTNALQAADLAALRFPQAAHLAVAALLEQDPEPVVRVGTADAFDLVELRRAVIQRHAAAQAVGDLVRHAVLAFRRAHAAHVFAGDFMRGMHHRVGQLAVGGEQQQAGGVDVQAADGDPARTLEGGQGLEDGRAAFGSLARGDLAFGLVIHQHPGRFAQCAGDEGLAVDLDPVAALDAGAQLRDFAVDLDHAVGDALLERAARTEPGLG